MTNLTKRAAIPPLTLPQGNESSFLGHKPLPHHQRTGSQSSLQNVSLTTPTTPLMSLGAFSNLFESSPTGSSTSSVSSQGLFPLLTATQSAEAHFFNTLFSTLSFSISIMPHGQYALPIGSTPINLEILPTDTPKKAKEKVEKWFALIDRALEQERLTKPQVRALVESIHKGESIQPQHINLEPQDTETHYLNTIWEKISGIATQCPRSCPSGEQVIASAKGLIGITGDIIGGLPDFTAGTVQGVLNASVFGLAHETIGGLRTLATNIYSSPLDLLHIERLPKKAWNAAGRITTTFLDGYNENPITKEGIAGKKTNDDVMQVLEIWALYAALVLYLNEKAIERVVPKCPTEGGSPIDDEATALFSKQYNFAGLVFSAPQNETIHEFMQHLNATQQEQFSNFLTSQGFDPITTLFKTVIDRLSELYTNLVGKLQVDCLREERDWYDVTPERAAKAFEVSLWMATAAFSLIAVYRIGESLVHSPKKSSDHLFGEGTLASLVTQSSLTTLCPKSKAEAASTSVVSLPFKLWQSIPSADNAWIPLEHLIRRYSLEENQVFPPLEKHFETLSTTSTLEEIRQMCDAAGLKDPKGQTPNHLAHKIFDLKDQDSSTSLMDTVYKALNTTSHEYYQMMITEARLRTASQPPKKASLRDRAGQMLVHTITAPVLFAVDHYYPFALAPLKGFGNQMIEVFNFALAHRDTDTALGLIDTFKAIINNGDNVKLKHAGEALVRIYHALKDVPELNHLAEAARNALKAAYTTAKLTDPIGKLAITALYGLVCPEDEKTNVIKFLSGCEHLRASSGILLFFLGDQLGEKIENDITAKNEGKEESATTQIQSQLAALVVFFAIANTHPDAPKVPGIDCYHQPLLLHSETSNA